MKNKKEHPFIFALKFGSMAFLGYFLTLFWNIFGTIYFFLYLAGIVLWLTAQEKFQKYWKKAKKLFFKYFSYERGGVAF